MAAVRDLTLRAIERRNVTYDKLSPEDRKYYAEVRRLRDATYDAIQKCQISSGEIERGAQALFVLLSDSGNVHRMPANIRDRYYIHAATVVASAKGLIPMKPKDAKHKKGCEHTRSPIWLCDCPTPDAAEKNYA